MPRPARHLVSTFTHQPGQHCGSTALCDFFRAHGLDLTEPQAIGLGGAPGGAYMALPGLSPSRLFLPRNPILEKDAFAALGLAFDWRFFKDKKQAHDELIGLLAQDQPVLLQSDIRYLPHYNTKTHFNGHVIVAAGYDGDKEEMYVADTQFEGLQAVPFDLFTRARFSQAPPLPLSGNAFWLEPETTLPGEVMQEMVGRALRRWVSHRRGDTPLKLFMALSSLEKLVWDMPRFHEAPDADWVARFTYQIIERRGTGGGAFRRLYARWLEGLGQAHGEPLAEAASSLGSAAQSWTEAAEILKATSENVSAKGFEEAAGWLGEALKHETQAVAQLGAWE